VLLSAVKRPGELDTRYAGFFRQLHQNTGEGHVAPLDIKRMLDQPQQLPRAIRRQVARGDDGAARRLSVVDKTVGQRAFMLETSAR